MQPSFLTPQQIATGELLMREWYSAIAKIQSASCVKESSEEKIGTVPNYNFLTFPTATSAACKTTGFPLASISSGKSSAAIAAELSLSGSTDRSHGARLSGGNLPLDQEEPLDLSSKTSLQVATRNAVALRKARERRSIELANTLAATSEACSAAFSPTLLGEDSFAAAFLSSGLRKSSRKSSAKRSYSQADLEAAVKDIRSGLLGTRRASVVYGIPRSTLRNKIYKLDAAEAQNGEPCSSKRRRYSMHQSASTVSLRELKPRDTEDKSSVDETDESQAEDASLVKAMKEFQEKLACKKEALSLDLRLSNGIATAAENSHSSSCETWISKSPSLPLQLPPSLNQMAKIGIKNNQSSTNGIGSKNEKRQRPKRGQYRKYEKETLEEAVKSVRRGEMSVHRAGSYYGVPHSTLEYKVKERNLVKPKKCHDSAKSSSPESGSFGKKDSDDASAPVTPVAKMFANSAANEIVNAKTMAANAAV